MAKKKRVLLFFVFALICIVGLTGLCNASSVEQNTLFNRTSSQDTTGLRYRVGQLDTIARQNLDSLLVKSHRVLKESRQCNYKYGEWVASLQLSLALLNKGDNDSAIYYVNNALKIGNTLGDKNYIAYAHKRLGSCFRATGDFEKSVFHFIECEKYARETNNDLLLIDVLANKGITYRMMKDFSAALRNFNAIPKECPKLMDNFNRFLIESNIGHVYFDQRQYQRALANFTEAKRFALQIGDSLNTALSDRNLGNTYFKLGNYGLAEKYINNALIYYRKMIDRPTVETLLRTKGCIFLGNGKYREAASAFSMSMLLSKQLGDHRTLLSNYRNLASTYRDWRRSEPSNLRLLQQENEFLLKSVLLQDSLFMRENTEKALELERKYDSERKNAQIAVLEKETEIQKSRQLILFTGMGVLVLVMGVLVVAFQYVRKTNRTLLSKNYQIEQQKSQIEVQNKQLGRSINTQNKLFSIIAHDLRSPLASISNISVLLKMNFERGDFEKSESLVGKLEQRNTQVLQLTDNLLNWASSQTGRIKFMSEKLSVKEMLEEIVALFDENARQKNIQITCDFPEDLYVFADILSMKTVFRNLINNAIKFSFPETEVKVSYFQQKDEVIVKISDQGIGIPQESQHILFEITNKKQQLGTNGEKSSGLGLVICKEFVEQNKGRIWMNSVPQKGTNFFVSLPLFPGEQNHSHLS